MSCCNCNLFDIACLRAAAGIPAWAQNDNENLVQAYNDVITIELEPKLGACFAYFCELKAQIDDGSITEPAWWDELINKKLLNFAAKALKYYFVTAGLASGGNTGTFTAETDPYNIKVTRASLNEQANLLWNEVVKWLNKNAEQHQIECWLNNGACNDSCKKSTTLKFFGIY